MKYKGILFILLGISIVGVIITTCNRLFLDQQTTRMAADWQYAVEGEAPETMQDEEENNRMDTAETTAGAPAGPAAAGAQAAAAAVPTQAADEAAPKEKPDVEQAASEEIEAYAEETAAQVLSPLETTAAVVAEKAPEAPGPGMAGGASRNSSVLMVDESKNNYRTRLEELDVQIQKMRSTETESTTYSMKTAAENELKLWDSELNNIYNDLITCLDEEQTTKLVTEEREWMKARDAKAVEAAKKSAGGTLEGLEYTASLAASTRERAYELASVYEQVAE